MNNEPAPVIKKGLPGWIIFLVVVWVLGLLLVLAMGMVKKQLQPLSLGSPVQDFTITTFDGQSLSLSDLKGKTVVINFWASWCPNCIDEAAYLEDTWKQVKADGQVVFIGVDYKDTQTGALAYLEKYGISYANGPDLGSNISQQFRVNGVPETFLIGSDGTLQGIKVGSFISAAEIRAFIDAGSGN